MLIFSGYLTWQSSQLPPPEATLAGDEIAVGEDQVASERQAEVDRSAGDLAATEGEADRRESAQAVAPGERARSPEQAAIVSNSAERWSESFEGGVYRVRLENRGGGISSWKLLDERYTIESDEGDVPIELVTRTETTPVLFTTRFEDLGLGDLSRENFRVESASEKGAVFSFERDGVEVRKEVLLEPGSYRLELNVEVVNRTDRTLTSNFEILWPGAVEEGNDFKEQGLVALVNDDVERELLAGVGSPGFFSKFTGGGEAPEVTKFVGNVSWAGVDERYFVSALLPDDSDLEVRFEPIEPGKVAAVALAARAIEIRPGESVRRTYRAYIGPKVVSELSDVGAELERSINLGYSWLEPLTFFFHWLLAQLYALIPNYGVAIIIVTILVRVVTMPIMTRQMRSMEKMRELQPQLKEIQAKYKEDRQRQSEETMKLYKETGVNPLGGCLPMLLQFPVFIGLFYALQSTIELRHAPFMLWITDLSAPETLFTIPGLGVPVRVLPLVMGASMVLQQRMTPMTGMDPAQARMMTTVMPIMMTVLFYQFPSGLVLYWMVSNFLGIGHQLFVRRRMSEKS